MSNFFYLDPKSRQSVPLDVYLGNLGPLRHRVYQASPPGPLTNIGPFVQHSMSGFSDNGGPADSPTSPGSPLGPPRYIPPGPLHTIVIVEMPPLGDVIKSLEEDALPTNSDHSNHHSPQNGDPSNPDGGNRNGNGHGNGAPPPPPPSIAGRSLPLLFIRASDGVGYHSGRTIACENVFPGLDLGGLPPNAPGGNIDTGWLTAAHAAATAVDGGAGLHNWTLRVM